MPQRWVSKNGRAISSSARPTRAIPAGISIGNTIRAMPHSNAVELREREASLPRREEKAATASEKHEAEVEANSRKKAQQAAEGERRRVEREARIAKKRADHEAKVAEKMRAADHRSTPGN